MGSDDVLESVLGLGDLADLTVSNDDADYGYDVSGPACLEFFLMMRLLTPSHSLTCYRSENMKVFSHDPGIQTIECFH